MNEQELNKKLAEWAGFSNLRTRDTLSQPTEIGSPWLWGQLQNGTFIPLDFTQSLDACSKWLTFPCIQKLGRIDISIAVANYRGRIASRGMLASKVTIGKNDYSGCKPKATAYDYNTALALCLAIEKLIDSEAKS